MPKTNLTAQRRESLGTVSRFASLLFGAALLWAGRLLATSVIPIADSELYKRADVIVHGIVLSSDATVDDRGIPETVTVIEPLAVLKGQLPGSLVLHQPGGTLPDGRFFKLWGRPEYAPGREVVVFAIARPEGEYQTAEMLLGKFEVWQDEIGKLFAVPDLATGIHPGVEVGQSGSALSKEAPLDEKSPRELDRFLASLGTGVFDMSPSATPSGGLKPVHHAEKAGNATPLWGNIADSLYRWNNNATAAFTISGTANMDGGGLAEAQAALASWTNNPNSNINYTQGTGTSNILYVNNTSSVLGCGWTTCLSGGGVIGCGGPTGVGGSTAWRAETYTNINQAVAELRAQCAHNGFGSVITQSVLTHELGHTLGLGHSDQNVSTHDVCRGDEDAATMRSVVQSRITLGTDDQDAIRWLYGDGGNFCTPSSQPSVTGISPPSGPTAGGTSVTINGSNFLAGATVKIGGVFATGVSVTNSSSITATTGPHAPATVDVVVTNPDNENGTLSGGFTYVCVSVPTATVSGGGVICSGSSAQVVATLTGSSPWNLTWSDGFVQSGITASPATRIVAPTSTTTYTVTSVTSAFCAGTSSGSALVSVQSCVGGSSSGSLLPDGRSVSGILGATGSVYRTSSVASRSYSVEIDLPFTGAGSRSPMLSITRADGSSHLATLPLERAACDANAAARLTFTTSAADLSPGPLQIHVTDSVASGYPFRLRVAETTMFAPGWSTNGYSAFIVVQNSSDGTVSGQVVLLSLAGSTVTTLPFTLPVGGSIQMAVPSGLPVTSGSARLTHDGPPGSITAGLYMTSPGPAAAAFQWPFSSVRSYGASDGK